jgi:hypothetical protein
MRYKRNPHQAEFHEDVTSKFLHLSSGFGGGKSFAVVQKTFQLSYLNKNIPGGIVVPSIADFKKDLLPLFEEILETNRIRYRYHATDKWFKFPWSSAKAHVATAEKKIRGPNWGWCTINELTLIAHERYKEAIGRVRIKKATHPQIASSGTPEGTAHWAYETFVDQPIKNSRIIYGDTRNNLLNLNDDYVDALESSYDEIMLDAYLKGLFVNMTGKRFYYAYDPAKNDNKSIEQIPGEEVHVSLDYNVSPMVATLWNIFPVRTKNGTPLIHPNGQPLLKCQAFDSIVIEDGADTAKMCKAFDAYGLDPSTTTIYPDPAGRNRSTQGPPDNTILKNHGWHKIRVRLSAPQFRKRQLNVCNLLAKVLIQIHPVKCRPLKRDFEAVEQDKVTYDKIKDNPKLTHASDGADYMFDILFPLSGKKPESRTTKIR